VLVQKATVKKCKLARVSTASGGLNASFWSKEFFF